MSNDLGGVRQRAGQWRILRHIDQLISAGKLSEAEQRLDEAFPADFPDNGEGLPPLAMFLRARLRLLRDNAQAVMDLMRAAEHDPSLLLRAADEVERWLGGPGEQHDTPALRNELTRMRVLHERARVERDAAPESARLRPISPDVERDILLALASWRRDIRFAWAAECTCQHAPRWRHVELLLHMRPQMWHFLPGARERMERLHATISRELEGICGSLRLHVHPLAALPAHIREIRKAGRAIIMPSEPTPERPRKNGKETSHEREGGAQSEPPEKPVRRFVPLPRTMGRAAGLAMRSSLLAALLALPVYFGWQFVENEETRSQVSALEQRHAAVLARKYWRREAAAHPHLPWASAQAFLLMLKAGDTHASIPLLDAESRKQWARKRHSRSELRKLWGRWANCGTPATHTAHERAVLRWPLKYRTCAPLLLRREQGRWRVAREETRRLFATDAQGRWRLANDLPHGWLFGFRDVLFDDNGIPRPLRGAKGKNDLIRGSQPGPEVAASTTNTGQADTRQADTTIPAPAAPHAEKRPVAPPPALAKLRLQGHGTGEMAQMR